jgi:hypothetical protein
MITNILENMIKAQICFFLFLSINSLILNAQQNKGIEVISSEKDKKVDILFDGKLFTSYIYPADLEKPVLFPIYTSTGTVITRGFPRNPRQGERIDHPHHVGLWFNYGDVNGLDFWNNSYAIPADKKSNYGSVRHQAVLEAISGKEKGILKVKTNWIDSKGTVLLVEETSFTFTGNTTLRRIDRTTTLTAQSSKVTFKDNKEGMMAIRVDRAFEEPSDKPEQFTDANGIPTTVAALNNEGVNGVYRSSKGLEKGAVWGTQADWLKLSATKGTELITIAMIDHKKNVGYPAHWHARGYGLFSVNNLGAKVYNPQQDEFTYSLDPGKSVTFKHRILVKSGSFLSDEDMNKEFAEFNK